MLTCVSRCSVNNPLPGRILFLCTFLTFSSQFSLTSDRRGTGLLLTNLTLLTNECHAPDDEVLSRVVMAESTKTYSTSKLFMLDNND